MNFLQRMARRLRMAWAVFRDAEAGMRRGLPTPVVDPRIPEQTLREEARRRGIEDARRFLFDQWCFGVEGEDPEAVLDPPYVRVLQHRREAAVREHHDRQQHTTSLLSEVDLEVGEAERLMNAARQRMAQVATREYRHEERSLQAFYASRGLDPAAANAQLATIDDHTVWEGETQPLRAHWRFLIMVFLIGIVFLIQNYVYEYYLTGMPIGADATLGFTAATAAMTVVGPHLSGLIFRNRQATGYDRWLAPLALLALLPPFIVVGGLGVIAARLFDTGVNVDGGASRSDQLGLAPGTLVVVFTAVLLVAAVMAFMLGLARRHPFQEAYAGSRARLETVTGLRQRLGRQINPDYRVPSQDDGDDRAAVITQAYLSAEDAYYEGLQEGFADPTFTEAVLRRRGRRSPAPPDRS